LLCLFFALHTKKPFRFFYEERGAGGIWGSTWEKKNGFRGENKRRRQDTNLLQTLLLLYLENSLVPIAFVAAEENFKVTLLCSNATSTGTHLHEFVFAA